MVAFVPAVATASFQSLGDGTKFLLQVAPAAFVPIELVNEPLSHVLTGGQVRIEGGRRRVRHHRLPYFARDSATTACFRA